MHPNELRQKFRNFFQDHNHQEIPSGSLIPSSDDPTVLFTTAGMQPLVPNLLGARHPKGTRLFDTQKCIRTPDIDEVGDDTHLTFFEMLGNWSLGDYFKEEAIELAYDFFVKELGLDPNRFAITIFQGDKDAPKDEEAKRIWLSKPGITPEQIFEFDKKDNFWGPAGKTGPCGPCSEIHYDRGEKYGENFGPNCDDNQRFVEIWNLVFMEFDKRDDGSYAKLSQKNVDTGVGFERLLSVLQQTDSPFDTELFENILKHITELSGTTYRDYKRSFRIIGDHIRAATFCIADGVTPGNEGRNYVLRRIIRRAIREGKQLGINKMFMSDIAHTVIAEYAEHYPEIKENENTIFSVLDIEEANFRETLERGEKKLLEIVAGKDSISGADAFRLFDTYGFPFDLTKDFAQEQGVDIDEAGFREEMKKQQERSRTGAAASFERNTAVQKFAELPASTFLGYDSDQSEAEVLGILPGNEQEVFVVLDQTPFYAESGGQIGDTGTIKGENGEIDVTDCQKTATGVFIHTGKVSGLIRTGDKVKTEINPHRRGQIMRHHSLAHLFLGAAQQVLGKDVHQAGSHVNERRMRIDMTFPRSVNQDEIQKIEALITEAVTAAADTTVVEKSLESAKAEGVEATFGEKYGDVVRTVKMGRFSYELCGGTHVKNTAQIGAVKIVSESGVSAGVRRIEAVCGESAQKLLQEKFAEITKLAATLKVPEKEIKNRIDTIFLERKEMLNELGNLQQKLAAYSAQALVDLAQKIGNHSVVIKTDVDGDAKMLSTMARSINSKGVDIAVVGNKEGNIAIASIGDLSAGELLKKITAEFGGGGGGSPQFASGGGVQQPIDEKIANLIISF